MHIHGVNSVFAAVVGMVDPAFKDSSPQVRESAGRIAGYLGAFLVSNLHLLYWTANG